MKYFAGSNQEKRANRVNAKDRVQSFIWAAVVTALVFLWRYLN